MDGLWGRRTISLGIRPVTDDQANLVVEVFRMLADATRVQVL